MNRSWTLTLAITLMAGCGAPADNDAAGADTDDHDDAEIRSVIQADTAAPQCVSGPAAATMPWRAEPTGTIFSASAAHATDCPGPALEITGTSGRSFAIDARWAGTLPGNAVECAQATMTVAASALRTYPPICLRGVCTPARNVWVSLGATETLTGYWSNLIGCVMPSPRFQVDNSIYSTVRVGASAALVAPTGTTLKPTYVGIGALPPG